MDTIMRTPDPCGICKRKLPCINCERGHHYAGCRLPICLDCADGNVPADAPPPTPEDWNRLLRAMFD